MTENLTPPHLRCVTGSCPSIHQLEGGRLLIVGTHVREIADVTREQVGVAPTEAAVVIDEDLLSLYIAEKVEEATKAQWQPIETARNIDDNEIVALSPAHCDGKRPIVLRWFKYNGLAAWRDWDADPHWPTHWMPLPPSPEAKP